MATTSILTSPPLTTTIGWQDIHGANDWKGVIDPLHPELRDAGMRYGEFVEAIYDAIDMEESSEFQYFPLVGKSHLFASVGVKRDYTVTRYLYSTLLVRGLGAFLSSTKASTAWVGFVAVSSDAESRRLGRRDVAVVIRGTKARAEWWINTEIKLAETKLLGMDRPLPRVMSGFLSMYVASDPSQPFGDTSLRAQISAELARLVQQEYKGEDVSVTFVGHSMGAGMAPLAAADYGHAVKDQEAEKPEPGHTARIVRVAAFVYGAPMTGDVEFKKRAERACKVLRIVSTGDVVTWIPSALVGFVHCGVEWKVDWSVSPYVQRLGVGMRCHNLELYLHCIAGQRRAPVTAPASRFRSRSRLFAAAAGGGAGAENEDEDNLQGAEIPDSIRDHFKRDPELLAELVEKEHAICRASKPLRDHSDHHTSSSFSFRSRASSSNAFFELVIQRDVALMNKTDDIVIKELRFPTSWWIHGFKGMRNIDGLWLPRHEWPAAELPTEDNPDFN